MRSFSIQSVSDLEELSYQVRWQYFEKLVAFIFSENGFDTKQNVVVKFDGTKRQFDVIARDSFRTFLVECKKWRSRREQSSALKSAVRKHLERCALYSELYGDKETVPLVVTLLDHDITEHDGVQVVPIMKLNMFLQEFGTI